MRTGRGLVIVVVGLITWVAGCATGSPTGPAGGGPSTGPPASEQAGIFTAVLRQYLTTGDNSFGDDHRFPVAYVLDRTDPAAAEPMGGPDQGAPIPAEDQTAILAATADIGRIEFIADRTTVIKDTDGCTQVRGDGVLIVLGPPVAVDDHREVAIHGFVACLGATWFTYVVERDGAGWRTNGTTGPSAIA